MLVQPVGVNNPVMESCCRAWRQMYLPKVIRDDGHGQGRTRKPARPAGMLRKQNELVLTCLQVSSLSTGGVDSGGTSDYEAN